MVFIVCYNAGIRNIFREICFKCSYFCSLHQYSNTQSEATLIIYSTSCRRKINIESDFMRNYNQSFCFKFTFFVSFLSYIKEYIMKRNILVYIL